MGEVLTMPHVDLPRLEKLAEFADPEVIDFPLPRGIILYSDDDLLSSEKSSAAKITAAGPERVFDHIMRPLIDYPGPQIAQAREALPESLDDAPEDVALHPRTPLERLLIEFRHYMLDHYDPLHHKELWQVIRATERFGRLAVLAAVAEEKDSPEPGLPQAS